MDNNVVIAEAGGTRAQNGNGKNIIKNKKRILK